MAATRSNTPNTLPYSTRDVTYDNDKSRHRSIWKMFTQAFHTFSINPSWTRCTTGKFLALLMICGLAYLLLLHQTNHYMGSSKTHVKIYSNTTDSIIGQEGEHLALSSVEYMKLHRNFSKSSPDLKWVLRQKKVKEAFVHAWSGYKIYAMGNDELKPLSKQGIDGLGGLGATIVDSLDTAMIMGLDHIVAESGTWIERNLLQRIRERGQVNLFETTIRILGGLLSAYHLTGVKTLGQNGSAHAVNATKSLVYLEAATALADRLLSAFTSSPTSVPFSDVVLHDQSAHPAAGGLSSTAEVCTLQLEFNYLSTISGNSKYRDEAMKVMDHVSKLPKMEGLVPIYISPHSGQFVGENIRLGSRGDSYYEYIIKVWLQQGAEKDNAYDYLHKMFVEAMDGVKHHLVRRSTPKGLTFVGELPNGIHGAFSSKMDHLVCFLPGTLALGATRGLTRREATEANFLTPKDLENLALAEELARTCFEIYSVTSTGLAPEIVYFKLEGSLTEGLNGGSKISEYVDDIIIKPFDSHNLLRPEAAESLFILYRITEDPRYRDWGWQIFQAFEKHTKVDTGGYTSLNDVTVVPPPKRDKMETFFLGETLKYLYLLFGEESILPLDKFVFNTEAHPLPLPSRR